MFVADPDRGFRSARFLVTFALLFGVLVVWSVATPRFGSPDENQHTVKAYALMHGDPGRIDPATGHHLYRTPTYLSGELVCYQNQSHVPADCVYRDPGDGEHETKSNAAGYPPLFYYLVGTPALVTSGETMLQLMRVLTAFWVALLIAAAVHQTFRIRHRAPFLPAFLVVLSPFVLFLGGTVNPSAITIAAALAVWTGGFLLLRGEPPDRIGVAVSRVGAPLCLLLLLRRDSVLWAVLEVGVLLALARPEPLRALVRSWVAWAWAAVCLACAVVQTTVTTADAGTAFAAAGTGSVRSAVGELPNYGLQMVGGVLGWLDAFLPAGAYLVFYVVLGFLLLASLGFAARRFALLIGGVFAVILIMPVIVGRGNFPYFQGRYMLPFAIGLPLVAALGLAERPTAFAWPARLRWILVAAVVVAHVAAFAQTMHRFTAGEGEWWFLVDPPWRPAIASPTKLVVLYAVMITATLVWLAIGLAPERDHDAGTTPTEENVVDTAENDAPTGAITSPTG